jgi:signal transduction histidine kinase/Tfp pilus assembly protein PilF
MKHPAMVSQAKFFAILIMWLAFCPFNALGQSEVEHFQSFFDEKNSPPLEKALLTATTRLDQAIEINDASAEAHALKTLGLLHVTRTHDYEKAMDFFIQSLRIEDSLNFKTEQTLTYVAIAKVFEVVGDADHSAQFLEQALKLNQLHPQFDILVMILSNLGKVNASMGKVDEAFKNYEQVLRYKDDIDQQTEAEALFNIGRLYTIQGKYADALVSHKRSLKISRATADKKKEALSLNDIGEVYRLMKNDEKSLANHTVALEIRQGMKDKRGMSESYNNLGRLYYEQNKIDQAIPFLLLALANGQEAQAQQEIFESYDLLSQSYKALEDYKNALAYKELSLAIHDFIQNEKQEQQLVETQNRYMLGKQQSQIEKLEALRLDRENQIAAQKKFKNFLIVLISLSLVIALLILFLYIFKRRSNAILKIAKEEVQQQNIKLQELNGTKDKFFSIISHDLKGPLNSLTAFSHLLIDHTDTLTKEEIQMLAKDLDKSVKNLFALLENLLEWSRSQTGNIDFTPESVDLGEILMVNKTLLEGQAKKKQIVIEIKDHAATFVMVHKNSVNTVVRNLISNAIKFTNEGGLITVDIYKTPDQLSVSIADTGVGMSPEVLNKLFRLDKKYSTNGTANEKGTGLGLILCKDFVEKNGGRMQVKSERGKGSVFTFSFPLTLAVPISKMPIEEPATFI